MEKQLYELSIWEDYLPNGSSQYSERKVAIIASDGLNSDFRAYDVTIQENINGEKTLTFSIPTKIYNNIENCLEDNPFFNLISNETKLKLRLGEPYDFGINDISQSDFINGNLSTVISAIEQEDEEQRWLDFIVKTVDISTSNDIAQITAKEIYVNELGKNGWNVLLDVEKQNNIGTLKYLANSILSDSDWKFDDTNSTKVIENKQQPIFSLLSDQSYNLTNILTQTQVITTSGDRLYFFYDDVEWYEDSALGSNQAYWRLKQQDSYQVLYFGTGKTVEEFLDDNHNVVDDDYLYNFNTTISNCPLVQLMGYNGRKIQQTQVQQVEPILDRAVKLYTAASAQIPYVEQSDIVYGYQTTEYISSVNVNSYLTNGSLFSQGSGWKYSYYEEDQQKVQNLDDICAQLYPSYTPSIDEYFKYLRLHFSSDSTHPQSNFFFLNIGPKYANLDATIGKKFIVRLKGRWINKDDDTGIYTEILDLANSNAPKIGVSLVAKSNLQASDNAWISAESITNMQQISWSCDSFYQSDNDYRTRGYAQKGSSVHQIEDNEVKSDENQYFYTILTVDKARDYSKYDIGFKITIPSNAAGGYSWNNYDLCIEDIQLFDYVLDNNNELIFLEEGINAVVHNKNVFYIVNSDNEVVYLSEDESKYIPLYANGFIPGETSSYESMRQINVKESNYFNSLQTLAESFEVWVSFYVKHRKDGKLLLDSDGNPYKMVKFSRYAPGYEINNLGFKYGVNLKSISRNDDSNAIASKLIVKYNSQEYAEDGMCTIARAKSNPSGETEIYNFDYYVSKGMLDYTQVMRDLYGLSVNDMALYTKLRKINNNLLSAESEKLASEKQITIWEAKLQLYSNQVASIEDEIKELTSQLSQYTDTQKKNEIKTTINALKIDLKNYQNLEKVAEKNINEEQAKAVGQTWSISSLEGTLSTETIPQGAHAFALTKVCGVSGVSSEATQLKKVVITGKNLFNVSSGVKSGNNFIFENNIKQAGTYTISNIYRPSGEQIQGLGLTINSHEIFTTGFSMDNFTYTTTLDSSYFGGDIILTQTSDNIQNIEDIKSMGIQIEKNNNKTTFSEFTRESIIIPYGLTNTYPLYKVDNKYDYYDFDEGFYVSAVSRVSELKLDISKIINNIDFVINAEAGGIVEYITNNNTNVSGIREFAIKLSEVQNNE